MLQSWTSEETQKWLLASAAVVRQHWLTAISVPHLPDKHARSSPPFGGRRHDGTQKVCTLCSTAFNASTDHIFIFLDVTNR